MKKVWKISIILMTAVLCCLPLRAQTGKWTQLHPNNSPSARRGHGMAPIGDDKVLLFGRSGNNNMKPWEDIILIK